MTGAIIIGLAIAGEIIGAGAGAAMLDSNVSGSGGGEEKVSDASKQAAKDAQPVVQKAYETRDELNAKNPEVLAALKNAVESMKNTIDTAVSSDAVTDVADHVGKTISQLQKIDDINQQNPSTASYPDPVPPALQNLRDASTAFVKFVNTFPKKAPTS